MNGSTLLPIKLFSRLTGTNPSTLRYYDEIGLLSPVKRGENNYRYYSALQTTTVSFINTLISLGVPLAQIRELARSRTPETTLEMLTRQEARLDNMLHELQASYSVLHAFRNNIQSGLLAKEEQISVCELDDMPIVMGPANDFEDNEYFYETFMTFCNSADRYRINLSFPIGGYYETMDAFLAEPSEPTNFFSLDPSGQEKREAGEYLVGYKRGYYGEMDDLPEQLAEYARENNLTLTGPVYIVYLHDELCVKNYHNFLSQIAIRLAPGRCGKNAALHDAPAGV